MGTDKAKVPLLQPEVEVEGGHPVDNVQEGDGIELPSSLPQGCRDPVVNVSSVELGAKC